MTLAIASPIFSASANGLAGAYIDQNYLDPSTWTDNGTHVAISPWNVVSPWIWPWRAYQTTIPASQFINGVGINFNVNGLNAAVAAEMLANHGFKRVRINIGWGNFDYNNPSNLISGTGWFTDQLQAAQHFGLRPLLVLNDDQAVPCPFQTAYHTVEATAAQGATTVQLDGTSDLTPGYSGISYIPPSYTMNQVLITAKDASTNTVTLSQGLPVALAAQSIVRTDTFKYIPFDGPTDFGGTPDPYYNATQQMDTLTGWNTYVLAVADIAAKNLGTSPGNADMGFDMELWNEVTVDDQFLSLRSYYGQPVDSTNFGSVVTNLMTTTVDTFSAFPDHFNGVVLEDGFANENNGSSAYNEPARVGALGKHLYPQYRSYPADEVKNIFMLNALLQLEAYPYPFVPTYTELMPEYFATIQDPDSPIQDLCPFTTQDVYGTHHGENSRMINGQVVPCTVFVSEIGLDPHSINSSVDAATAMLIKAKADSRILVFYLNKGATQVDLFCAVSFGPTPKPPAPPFQWNPDTDFQLFSQNFVDYAASNSTYPVRDTSYVSPALKLIGNIVKKMNHQLDPSLNGTNTRALTVNGISDTHDHYQFLGDGTAAHPTGYDRERFAFLPYQANAHHFVIPYYVMTTDITQPLTPEKFTIDISGINAVGATIAVYDPLNDVNVPYTVNSRAANEVNLTLTAADYPYLLIVQEAN